MNYTKNNNNILTINDYLLTWNNLPSDSGPVFPTDGLINRYDFENDLVDSINGKNLSGSPSYDTGKFGNAVKLSGEIYNTDSTYFRDNFLYDKSWTANFWVNFKYVTNWGSERALLSIDGPNSSPYTRVWMYYNFDSNNNSISLALERYSSSDCGNVGGIAIAGAWTTDINIKDGNWHMFTFRYDNLNYKEKIFYVDGIERAFGISSNWDNYGNANLHTSINASGLDVNGNFQDNRNGTPDLMFDQILLYNRALDEAEITALYNNGQGLLN